MIDLQNVLKEWDKDCQIDSMNLDESARLSPNLHSKYLQLYSVAKLQLKKVEHSQKVLLKKKYLYYNGKMSQEEIEREGWPYDPFDGLHIIKTNLEYYYDSDLDIQTSEEKVEYWKTVISTLKDILENIKWRQQTIRNIIDFRKFQSGG